MPLFTELLEIEVEAFSSPASVSYLVEFPTNLGDVSEEQGERFHQDIKVMEQPFLGRWDSNMMADYFWA